MKFTPHRVAGFFKFKLEKNEEMVKDGDIITYEDMRYKVTGTFYTAKSGRSGLCVLELLI